MDKETEIRRRITYLTDLIQKSNRAINGDSKIDYYDYYSNYRDVVNYLNRSAGYNTQIPELIKPGFFNRRLDGFWAIAILGILNPIIAVAILIVTFPISVPCLIMRGIMVRRTKNRIEDLELYLIEVVASLKEQQVEMIMKS